MKKEIKFYWNGSFAGVSYSMLIDNETVGLGDISSNENEARKIAVKILKQDYNIEYKPEDIIFEWGGRL